MPRAPVKIYLGVRQSTEKGSGHWFACGNVDLGDAVGEIKPSIPTNTPATTTK